MTDSAACFFKTAAARCAAALASPPCPTPSITASNTPCARVSTTCKSPETFWPAIGRAATLHSMSFGFSTTAAFMSMQPFFHGHSGPFAHFGFNVKLIHQPFGAGQSDAQPLVGGIAVLHRLGNVLDAGAFVARHDQDTALVAVVHRGHDNFAAFGVIDDISRHFGYGGGNQGQVRSVKAQLECQSTSPLARRYNVSGRVDGNARFIFHVLRFSWPAGRDTPNPLPDPGRSPPLPASGPVAPSQRPRPAGCRQ